MKTRIFISVKLFLIISICGSRAEETTKKNLPFECPVDCKSSPYKPICSRGKSYANLCVLKQQICNGETEPEVFKDVEDCPKYEKDDDANGASVEAIDKNGVVFRNFFDSFGLKKKKSSPAKNRVGKKKLRDRLRKGNYFDKKPRLQMCEKNYCTNMENVDLPPCIPETKRTGCCFAKRLVCGSYLPVLAIFVDRLCEK